MKQNAALGLYASLDSFGELNQLILNGEAEHLYLECKAPHSPNLDRGLVNQLARVISAFSNTEGGVIILGIETERHTHSGLDILKQISFVADSERFRKVLINKIPIITAPAITDFDTKVVKERRGDTKGIILLYVPKAHIPIQSTIDNVFYLRSGDAEIPLPHETLRRLFLTADVPQLEPVFDQRLVKFQGGAWIIPVGIANHSISAGENITISATILNPDACAEVTAESMEDASEMNPGKKVFMKEVPGVCHQSLNIFVGELKVKMKKGTRLKRLLSLKFALYANRMPAREWLYDLHLTGRGFKSRLKGTREVLP